MTAALRVEERAAPYLVAPLLTDHLDSFASAPEGFKRLRELVLNLAVRGRLVPQDTKDEPATKLLDRIKAEKAKLNSRLRPSSDRPEAPYGLPVGWAWTSLGEAGITNPRNEARDDAEAAFVPMAMIPAALGIPHLQEVRPWQEIKNGFTHFADNDVGVAKITPCFENGKSCVFRNLKHGIGAGTTELHVFRHLGDTVLPSYALIYLKNPAFLRNGERVMTGSAGQKRLPRSFFEGNPFPLPPLAEQSRIVAKVEELMALIAALEAKVGAGETARGRLLDTLLAALADSPDAAATADAWAQLAPHFDLLLQTPADVDRLQQTLLQLAVKGRLVPQDPNDEPADELLKRIRAEKERLVAEGKSKRDKAQASSTENEEPFDPPSGWQWARFGDLFQVSGGVTLGRKLTGKRTVSFPYLRVANVQRGALDLSQIKEVEIAEDELDRYSLRRDDLLITEGGDWDKVGRTAIWCAAIEPCLHQNHVFRARRISRDMNVEWLALFMNSAIAMAYFQESAKQTTNLASINMGELKHCAVPLPPLPEQSRIVVAIASLTALCDRLRERLAARRALSAKLAAALTESALQ